MGPVLELTIGSYTVEKSGIFAGGMYMDLQK